MNNVNVRRTITLAASTVVAVLLAGCASTNHPHAGDFPQVPSQQPASLSPAQGQAGTNSQPAVSYLLSSQRPDSIVLREGDTIRVMFPGSPSLNTSQQIRRDGKITLPLLGEMKAAGFTAVELEKEVLKIFGAQLVNKEVNVIPESTAYWVFVTGAVGRPGKIVFDRPISALEAVIDAGVDYTKANLKKVTIIRRPEGRQAQYYQLNLKRELQGPAIAPFYLQPSDIVFVRERFSWF
jgi:polysaccharide export outer membrane protein